MENNGGIFLMPTIPASTPVSIYQLQLLQTRLSKAVWAASKVPPSSSMDSGWSTATIIFPIQYLFQEFLSQRVSQNKLLCFYLGFEADICQTLINSQTRKEPFAQPQCSLKEFFSRASEAALWPIYSHCIFLLYTRTTFENTCCHTRLGFSLFLVVCWTLKVIKTMQIL